jgi:hypothetical protein
MNRALARYPHLKNELVINKLEVERVYELYEALTSDKMEGDMIDNMHRYVRDERFKSLCICYPAVFYVLMMSRVFSIPALMKYLTEYTRSPVNTKERVIEVSRVYFINFKTSDLKDHDIVKSEFIQFYTRKMEELMQSFEDVADKKKTQELKNREMLKMRLKKIDIVKLNQL